MVAGQLKMFLEETDYLGPFQSGFGPRLSTETALIALADDLLWAEDRGSAALLILMDL